MNWKALLGHAARPLEVAIGLFFIIGAVVKAYDIELFWTQIAQYGILRQESWLDATAVGVVGMEAFLGAALVTGWRARGLLHAAVALLLAGFTGLIAYAWAFHGLEDCGCLGRLEMTPTISIIKNIVLLGLVGAAYAGTASRPSAVSSTARRTAARALTLAVAVVVAGYAWLTLETAPAPQKSAAEPAGRFSEFAGDDAGQQYDLGRGDWLVAVMSATCEHCRASVPDLNALLMEDGMPAVAGLVYGEPSEIDDFRSVTQPFFPLHTISVRVFFGLIGTEPPRFYAVRDGEERAHWDDAAPSSDALRAVFE